MSNPIAFLDESGDESGKLARGASPLFSDWAGGVSL